MNAATQSSSGFVKTALLASVLVVSGLLASLAWFRPSGDRHPDATGDLTSKVFRGEFVSFITEPGEVESSKTDDVRCRVRQRGGTPILELVDEGSFVKQGDKLAQLDDSDFRDELVEQKIRVATDKAAVIQARSDLAAAEFGLKEFENGVFGQELKSLKSELALARENRKRAEQYLEFTQNLFLKGYVTKSQMEADRFAVTKAEMEVEMAESKVHVFQNYSQDRMKAELEAEKEKQQANLEASQFTLEQSRQRLDYYQQQVDNCLIRAPGDGQVVYANDIEGRGDSGIVIEEGVNVLEGQVLFRLPDPSRMQVVARVNDSRINSVQAGQDVTIRLDTAPDVEIAGKVRQVADFPLPRRWSQAPIEYEVFIDVIGDNPLVRTGLRAKARIFVERLPEAVQLPVSAIIDRNDRFFVVVARGARRELRAVELGPDNGSHVVVRDGVQPGESVLIDPDAFRRTTETDESPDNAGS